MILLPYELFCFLSSKSLKTQFTLKAPEATRSASTKERIRNQERKSPLANILHEPSPTSRSTPQRPEIIKFPLPFLRTPLIRRSVPEPDRGFFYPSPDTNPPTATAAPPLQPQPGRGRSTPAAAGAAGARGGARCPARSRRSPPRSRSGGRGGRGGSRALTELSASGSGTGARAPQRQRGLRALRAAILGARPARALRHHVARA